MISHSHPATKQDLWVLEKFGKSVGSFVELGAFNGIKHSNTLLLEKFGWRGTLIEAHTPFYYECIKNRPKAECLNVAIGDGSTQYLVVGGQYTGLTKTMPAPFLAEHTRRGSHSYSVETRPLIDYVKHTDYLSLDTEGGEYGILKDWFEAGGLAKVITVEFRYDQDELARIEWLASEHGYYIDEVRGFDICLTRDNL